MAQHDYVIDNQSFPATRTDINNVLLAISSTNSGTSAPSTTYANQLWYDTSANKLYIRNEDNDAWIPLFLLDQSNDVAGTLATEIDIEDASGTDTAGTALTIKGGAGTGSGAGGSIIFQTADGGSSGSSVNAHATRVTITDDGLVGIGTAPSTALHVKSANDTVAIIESSDATAKLQIKDSDSTNGASLSVTNETFNIQVNGGTRATIDSSGNVLVGKTSDAFGTAGCEARPEGALRITRDGSTAGFFNRLNSDGVIVNFYKDSSSVGTIGNTGIYPFFAGSGAGIMPRASDIVPTDGSGALSDNTEDLGDGAVRFDDVFATNGTIQTSDQNEKQQIASLTSAEITAAKAISKLFKTYKWNDSVTENGDNARTHTGVIAQEVQQAMTDAGLDATKYAFWCSDTWWETQTEVAAVEAADAVTETQTNEEGEEVQVVVKEAVEAQDAYTRTDTYETADAAPEGATERTRLGVRYPELLAFIGAATEQRLADIETRLTALEG